MVRLAEQLRPNEKVAWQGKPAMIAFLFSYGLLPASPFGLFFLLALALVHYASVLIDLDFLVIVGWALFLGLPLVLFLAIITWAFLAVKNTEYLITDQRLITQTGAIGRAIRSIDLENIQEVGIHVGISDRLVGTGVVIASTAGRRDIGVLESPRWGSVYGMHPSLVALKEPNEVQKLLQEAIHEVKQARNL
jgi:uncharacterized membrane protein YdbT with pleckstrin-like domain